MRVVPLLLLVLAGCAGLERASCQQASWYDLGFRDAIFGLQRQDDLYTRQCEAQGVKVDAARYVQGWVEGKYEADQRIAGSHD
jgi:hypothetical protein